MLTYLLAVNLFALAALLLGLSNLSSQARPGRLLPLFLLVISRSLTLIIFLATPEPDPLPAILNALEVFSTFCLGWVLVGSPANLPSWWPGLARLGAGVALLLTLASLLPFWPVPFQIHSLIIAVLSAPFVLISRGPGDTGRLWWSHLAALFMLALVGFLSLLGLSSLSWFVTLLAYTFVLVTLHWENVDLFRHKLQSYSDRQETAEALFNETMDLNRERERLLSLGEMIGTVPNLSQAMEHIVSSVARATRVDQAALLDLGTYEAGQVRLVAVYSPERPVHITTEDEIVFNLANCPPLEKAMAEQRQQLLPQPYIDGLQNLYALWSESRTGPTLIQPLLLQGRTIGALILGNPVTQRLLPDSDAYLCRALAPQIATMVEYRRRYLELEWQAETMATALQKQRARVSVEPGSAPAGEADRYLEILEIIDEGVVVSDTTGRVCQVNGAAERILGQSRQDLVGQPIGRIYGEIDSRESIDDLMVAFSRRSQPLPTFIEDDNRAIQGRLIPWRNEAREWLGIVAIFKDVTREVNADQARNMFIAALSRELRAPLTAIKGYTELIMKGALGEYSARQLQIQQIIQSSADRMVAVLDNVLQISSQDHYKTLPWLATVDITKIIDESLHETTPLAHLCELRLFREVQDQLPPLVANPRHLRLILDNLLTNACHFTPPGGHVTVRAWVQPERESNINSSRLILAVVDSGIGIPQIEYKRIFDPFYQIKDQNVSEQRGMGMGLAVVKELVELYKGRVWVESIVGEGSIFQVALPLTQE